MPRNMQFIQETKKNSPTLSQEEMMFTTDEKKVYVGDGSNAMLMNQKSIMEISSQIVEMKYYISTESFPLNAPESNDQPRLQRFVDYLSSREKTGFIMNGDYILNSPLQLGDNVNIILDVNATLIRNHSGGGSAGATIRNKKLSVTDRNRNISITGGNIRASDRTKTGKHLVFWGVDNIKLFNLTTRETYGDWTTLFRDCVNVFGSNLDFDTIVGDVYTDGVHVVGGRNYIFSNCNIKSGDDCFSFTVETPEDTEIDGITITNCNLTTRRSSVIKMTTKVATTPRIKNIILSNITAKGGTVGSGEAIVITDMTDSGRISSIKLKDILVDCSEGAGVGFRLRGAKGITGDIDIIKPQGKGVDINMVNDLELKIRVDSPRTPDASAITLNNVEDFDIIPVIKNATLHGVSLGSVDSPVSNGRIHSGRIKNSANTAIRLVNANGVDVLNNKISGVNGIVEDIGSDYNYIKHNDLRNLTRTKISTTGANSKARENSGYITENRSSFQLNGATTSITIPHGLSGTPSVHGISITFRSSLGDASQWWISDVTNTTFKFNVDTPPGVNVDISYEANMAKNI